MKLLLKIIALGMVGMLALPWCSQAADAAAASAPVSEKAGAEGAYAAKSGERVARILQALKNYSLQGGLDDPDFKIMRAVLNEFIEKDDISLAPLDPPEHERTAKRRAREDANLIIAKKFPPLDMEKLERAAEDMYPTYKQGDVVEVTYQANPMRRATVKDIYRGRTENALIIGAKQILVSDIQSIPNTQELLLKFDIPQSLRLRQTYVTAEVRGYEEKMKQFSAEVLQVAIEKALQDAAEANERRGYILHEGRWYRLRDLASLLIAAERERLRKPITVAALPPETVPTAQSPESQPPDENGNKAPSAAPEPGDAPVPEAPAADSAGQGDTGADEPVAATASEPETQVAATPAPVPVQAPPPAKPKPRPVVAATPANEDSGGGLLPKIIGLVVVLLAAAGAAFKVFKNSQPRGRFCSSRGVAEREFWSLAEQNRVEMKFVAFKFPNAKVARDALYSLSFLTEVRPNGPFTAGPPIFIGLYQDEDDFVAMIGGKCLTYPMWNEARFRFAQFAEGIEFKLSEAPHRDYKVLDQTALASKAITVEHIDTMGGGYEDFSQYYKYRAPDAATAEKFLKTVTINCPGTYIIVETPTGNWAKNVDGIYQE